MACVAVFCRLNITFCSKLNNRSHNLHQFVHDQRKVLL